MFYIYKQKNLGKRLKIVCLRDLKFVSASHEKPEYPGVFKKVLLEGREPPKGDLQMVNGAKLPLGKSFKAHSHQDMEEIFILVKGKARIRIGGEENKIGKEERVVMPMGEVHEMKNTGSEDVEYIVIGISQGRGVKKISV